jgi:hypothetical protein
VCNYAEWERFMRRGEDAAEAGSVRDVISDVVARIDALIDDALASGCAPETAEWVRGRGRRSAREWVA